MRILIAPDKFKGTLSAREVAENVALGLRDVLPDAEIDIIPLADGGEGTAEVICEALGGTWLKCPTHDPLGRGIDVRYAYIEKTNLAVMEMSETAGVRRLNERERDPFRATTFGVGEMILDAKRRGVSEIIIGLGGSVTNDGGFGMARALGFRFFDQEHKHELRSGVGQLRNMKGIAIPKNLSLPRVIAAADVRNPLLGPNGATRVFGPQKGATAEKIELLERAMTRLADEVKRELRLNFRNEPGAGAAGGLGFGLMTFCGAKIRPGFDVVAEAVALELKMKDADVVITGEGRLDQQTLEGKTPAGVARLARKLEKPVYAIVGRADEERQVRDLFDGVCELAHATMTDEESMGRAPELLREKARELANSWR